MLLGAALLALTAVACDGTFDGPDSGVAGDWVSLPAGSFTMGSPATEPCREPSTAEKETQHGVTLTHRMEVWSTEVTREQFFGLMQYDPSYFPSCGSFCPVESLTWHEAVAFCNALSKAQSLTPCYSCSGSGSTVTCQLESSFEGSKLYDCTGYRLLTEAEWEYAYRAGTTSALYNGDLQSCSGEDAGADRIGWYDMNSSNCPHPAGQKQLNAWGLYDMAGNVFEWVQDRYQSDLGSAAVTDPTGPASGSERVARGGGWYGMAANMRAADRKRAPPTASASYAGFRCGRRL